jgi:Gpi18-like mannosyltransferase
MRLDYWVATLTLQLLPVQMDSARWYYGMMTLDSSPFGWLWAPWQREDAIWYTAIATRGYSSNDLSTAFFPLFPALIRALTSLLPINGIAAGLLISSAAVAGAFALFYRLVYEEAGQETARRALIYLATFPTAFFLFAVYAESLFLLLVLGTWWSARNGHWGWACVCGGLAALTRAQGFLVVVPLAIIFWDQWRAGMAKGRSIFNLSILFILPVIYMVYLSQSQGRSRVVCH